MYQQKEYMPVYVHENEIKLIKILLSTKRFKKKLDHTQRKIKRKISALLAQFVHKIIA